MQYYKLLIVGNIYDNHIKRYIKHLKTFNPNVQIDILTIQRSFNDSEDLKEFVDTIHFYKPTISSLPLIGIFKRIFQFNRLLSKITSFRQYDIVNIHYPVYEQSFSVNHLKKLAKKIVLTPWGSDVYRVGNIKLKILKYLYRKTDYVCNPNTRFGRDVRRIFNLRKDQIVDLSIGSETIDYIIEHRNSISVKDARRKLSLEGDYYITCGYNASPAQNHKAIIDGITKFAEQFPGKISLLFPMTYPQNSEYVDEIKQYVRCKGLNAYFFTNYLDLPTLFLLRQSTDMFIHVQDTDANAGSVQEYLLLKKKVLNGEWLRYDNLEINGVIPYILVKDLKSIGEAIEGATQQDPIMTQDLIEYIESFGWNKWILKWDSFFQEITMK